MRRLLMALTVAVVLVAMLATTAAPAFAANPAHENRGIAGIYGKGSNPGLFQGIGRGGRFG